MHSRTIVKAMLDNGFLDPERHNPTDFVTFTTNAAKRIEASLADAPKPEAVSVVVAAMFDAGLCHPEHQTDPNEWIIYAELAIAELRVV
jgi:hypothetical protein